MQLTKPETKTPRTPKTPKGKTPQKSKPAIEAKSPKLATPAKNGAKVEKKPVTPQSAAPQSSKKFNRNEKRSLSTERPKSEGKPQQSAQNKTPESNKKRRQRKGSNSSPNKKQKIDFNKSKKINTNEQQEQEHPVFTDVKVFFPNVKTSYKESILKILDECESVTAKTILVLHMNQDMVKSKIEKIEKIKIKGKPLKVFTNERTELLLKKVIVLKKGVDVIELKNFYEAKSVDQIINFRGKPTMVYVLTFESKKAAAIASKKVYTFEEKEYNLRPFYARSEKKKFTATVKQGKRVQVEKTSEKPVQKKKEEDEEEDDDDDNDDEEVELDSDDMEDIDMDDEDDNDDDDDKEDDDDE